MDNNSAKDTTFSPPSPDVAELNQRRNLIKNLYREILGKDADINGLSYYTVHKEISEAEIRQQMTQSTDHRDMMIKAQKYPEVEKKCIEMEDQIIRLQNLNTEKDALINNLRAVVSGAQNPVPQQQYYQNPNQQTYQQMQNNDQSYRPEHSQDFVNGGQSYPPYPVPNNDDGSMINIQKLGYPKSRGCMGLIRSFFGL